MVHVDWKLKFESQEFHSTVRRVKKVVTLFMRESICTDSMTLTLSEKGRDSNSTDSHTTGVTKKSSSSDSCLDPISIGLIPGV